ncbi:MAG: OmpH family outer membrane protein [Selenomonadaceae bacterium]|nr:OmpH family outer membrane protein [Selenomonadaceae bacterium]
MLKLEKKHVKIVSVLIALVFIGSVVALALTQSGSIASAAPSGSVGVVDMNEVMMKHPDRQSAEDQLKATIAEVEKNFNEKAAGMSDEEKQSFAMQSQQIIAQRESELSEQLLKKVEETVKQVAEAKGLSVVVAKAAVVYGGNDITQDVVSRLGKK